MNSAPIGATLAPLDEKIYALAWLQFNIGRTIEFVYTCVIPVRNSCNTDFIINKIRNLETTEPCSKNPTHI